jgi:predicted adenine nucleotide alpha hydrolase (AANH) superfamily ATPase
MRLNLFGELHEDVAVSLNNLGSLFSSMNQYDMAVELYGKCLSVWEALSGKGSDRYCKTLRNIGIVYYRQKEYDYALPYFEEALKYYAEYPEQYYDSIKSIGALAAECFHYLRQDESVDQNELQKDLEEFKDSREGGVRCKICYTKRMKEAYDYAEKHGFDFFSTVMTISRQKNSLVLNQIGEELSESHPKTAYFYSDFKKNGGQDRSIELRNLNGLYQQTYCGCEYSVRDHTEH